MLYSCKLKVARNGLWSLRPTNVEQTVSTLVNSLSLKHPSWKYTGLCTQPHISSAPCVCQAPLNFSYKPHVSIPHMHLIMCPMPSPIKICHLCWVHSAKCCLQMLLLCIKNLTLSRPCCSQLCYLGRYLLFSSFLGYPL